MSKHVRLLTGHEVESMSEEWLAKLADNQSTYKHGVIRILPDGWLYPAASPRFLNRIQSFKVIFFYIFTEENCCEWLAGWVVVVCFALTL